MLSVGTIGLKNLKDEPMSQLWYSLAVSDCLPTEFSSVLHLFFVCSLKVCGISRQKNWKFQLCVSQTSQANRSTGNHGILGGITVGYETTTSHSQGRLSNNYTNNLKANDFY